MIRFSQFLDEARSAPLYHGTDISGLISVLSTRGFEPRTSQKKYKLIIPMNRDTRLNRYQKNPKSGYKEYKDAQSAEYGFGKFGNIWNFEELRGISTTRNIRFAKRWRDASVVFEFDHAEIARRYKIIPVQWFQNDGFGARKSGEHKEENEFEEFILFKGTIPLKYITQLHVKKDYEDDVIRIMLEKGIILPYVTY